MVRAAITFFIIAIFAYILGANGIAGISIEIGKILLYVFLFLALIAFVSSMVTGRKAKLP